MNQTRLIGVTIALGVAVFLGTRCVYIVREAQQALLLQFGEIRKVDQKPGLFLKFPEPFQNVVYIENRLIPLQTPELEITDSLQRRFVVDAVARWRVTDTKRFYQAVGGNIPAAGARIEPILSASIRRIIGQRPFNEVLAERRAEIMKEIEDQAIPQIRALGIELVDVRIRRADQPDEISSRTYERMRSDRQREATDLRARGQEEARRIKSEAENQAVVLRADAQRQSEIRRGEGESLRNKTFADAFSKDPDFFVFYRSMRAYETSLQGKDTSYVLSPRSDFFRFFENPGLSEKPAN